MKAPYESFRLRNEKRIFRYWLIAFLIWIPAAIAGRILWKVDGVVFSTVLIFLINTAYVIWVMQKTDIAVKALKGLFYRYIVFLLLTAAFLIGYGYYFPLSG
jgi:hypothetical protein